MTSVTVPPRRGSLIKRMPSELRQNVLARLSPEDHIHLTSAFMHSTETRDDVLFTAELLDMAKPEKRLRSVDINGRLGAELSRQARSTNPPPSADRLHAIASALSRSADGAAVLRPVFERVGHEVSRLPADAPVSSDMASFAAITLARCAGYPEGSAEPRLALKHAGAIFARATPAGKHEILLRGIQSLIHEGAFSREVCQFVDRRFQELRRDARMDVLGAWGDAANGRSAIPFKMLISRLKEEIAGSPEACVDVAERTLNALAQPSGVSSRQPKASLKHFAGLLVDLSRSRVSGEKRRALTVLMRRTAVLDEAEGPAANLLAGELRDKFEMSRGEERVVAGAALAAIVRNTARDEIRRILELLTIEAAAGGDRSAAVRTGLRDAIVGRGSLNLFMRGKHFDALYRAIETAERHDVPLSPEDLGQILSRRGLDSVAGQAFMARCVDKACAIVSDDATPASLGLASRVANVSADSEDGREAVIEYLRRLGLPDSPPLTQVHGTQLVEIMHCALRWKHRRDEALTAGLAIFEHSQTPMPVLIQLTKLVRSGLRFDLGLAERYLDFIEGRLRSGPQTGGEGVIMALLGTVRDEHLAMSVYEELIAVKIRTLWPLLDATPAATLTDIARAASKVSPAVRKVVAEHLLRSRIVRNREHLALETAILGLGDALPTFDARRLVHRWLDASPVEKKSQAAAYRAMLNASTPSGFSRHAMIEASSGARMPDWYRPYGAFASFAVDELADIANELDVRDRQAFAEKISFGMYYSNLSEDGARAVYRAIDVLHGSLPAELPRNDRCRILVPLATAARPHRSGAQPSQEARQPALLKELADTLREARLNNGIEEVVSSLRTDMVRRLKSSIDLRRLAPEDAAEFGDESALFAAL